MAGLDVLEGRAAVVTGAASGIGLAVTEAFVAAGMRVLMTDRDEERGDKGELERRDSLRLRNGVPERRPALVQRAPDDRRERDQDDDAQI